MKPGMILYREELGMLLMMTAEDAGEAIRLLARRFLREIKKKTEKKKMKLLRRLLIPFLGQSLT